MRRLAALAALLLSAATPPQQASDNSAEILKKIGLRRGIVAVVEPAGETLALDLAKSSDLFVYVQLSDAAKVQAIREAAETAGLLGTRLAIEKGGSERIHLADNIADAVVAPAGVPRAEVVRVLRPGGKGLHGKDEVGKAFPEGADEWTHPYHGADNNPQSKDQARGPFLTQFMATPWYA